MMILNIEIPGKEEMAARRRERDVAAQAKRNDRRAKKMAARPWIMPPGLDAAGVKEHRRKYPKMTRPPTAKAAPVEIPLG